MERHFEKIFLATVYKQNEDEFSPESEYNLAIQNSLKDQGIPINPKNPETELRNLNAPIGLANMKNSIPLTQSAISILFFTSISTYRPS